MIGRLLLAHEKWVRRNVARSAARVGTVPAWALDRLAREKLARTLRWVWDRSPAQRERWRAAGIARRDLASPGALSSLPFTTGADLSERPEDYLCVAKADLIHVLSTSGTKGRPKKVYLTARELCAQVSSFGTQFRRLESATRGLAIFDSGNPTATAGALARRGFEAAGMFGLFAGNHCASETHVALIREHGVDLVVATPTTAARIACETGPELASLGVRWLLLGAQPWTEDLRGRIESAWGAKALDVYGSTEFAGGIASECPEQDGLHLNEADVWPEVVEPATGRALSDGEEGELVLTTLGRRGMPLVRYRTRDLATLLPRGRCACGSPLRRMSRVRGRVDDMVKLGPGYNVFPDEFDRVLLGLPGVTDYQVIIEKSDGWRDVLRVTVERAGNRPVGREEIARALGDIKDVGELLSPGGAVAVGAVEFAAPGSLSAGRLKTPRILDRRQS